MNIFDEYEQWLQEDLLINDYQNQTLNESKEVMFKMFDEITKDLYQHIKWRGDRYKDDEGHKYIIICLKNFNKYFIKDIKIEVKFDKQAKDIAYFYPDACSYDFLSDKLENVIIDYNEKIEKPYNIDENEFYNAIFHELQHIYRHFQILETEEIKKMKNTKRFENDETYYNFSNNKEISSLSKTIYYCTNENEINSHLSEIYPYLKEHPEITLVNYKKYLNTIPSYKIILELRDIQKKLNDNTSQDYDLIKQAVSEDYYNLYKDKPYYQRMNLTPKYCFELVKKNVNNKLLYAEKKFYQFLKASLNKIETDKNKKFSFWNNLFK